MRQCQYESRRAELTTNLLRLYASASPDDVRLGMRWYPRARRIVASWSAYYGHSPDTVACVIAACSPQCDWRENLRASHAILAGRNDNTRALPSCLRKAERILRDRASDTLPYFPHGPKVMSFASNLQGYTDTVTVDTHAAQAALHDPTATIRLRWRQYGVLADCYRDAALHTDIVPCDFQAVIWHVWKRLFPSGHKRALLRSRKVLGDSNV